MFNRGRNFSGVFYPESCPPDFEKVIESFNCRCALSPLHTPDEEQKKSHYHIVFCFSGNKTIEQVREMMYKLGSGMVQPVNDICSMIRYLVHKDNPEKQQLDKSDIKCYHNIQIDKYFKSNDDKCSDMRKLVNIIKENKCQNFKDLMDLCIDNNDLLLLVLKYSYAINLYLRSI